MNEEKLIEDMAEAIKPLIKGLMRQYVPKHEDDKPCFKEVYVPRKSRKRIAGETICIDLPKNAPKYVRAVISRDDSGKIIGGWEPVSLEDLTPKSDYQSISHWGMFRV